MPAPPTMARLLLAIGVVAIWALLLPPAAAIAAVSSPSPASSLCDDVIMDMADCLPYVTDGSNVTSPSKGCCAGVAQVVAKSPKCICEALKEASELHVPVNLTRALGVSKICKLNVPPISSCNATSPPGKSPAPRSPPPKSPSVPSPTPVPPPPAAPPVSPAEPPAAPLLAPSPSGTAELKISLRFLSGTLALTTFLSLWRF